MAHLFTHDLEGRLDIVFGGCGIEEVPLLFDRGEFRIALKRNQVKQRVADALVGNLENGFPFGPARIIAALDHVRPYTAELHIKLVVLEL